MTEGDWGVVGLCRAQGIWSPGVSSEGWGLIARGPMRVALQGWADIRILGRLWEGVSESGGGGGGGRRGGEAGGKGK